MSAEPDDWVYNSNPEQDTLWRKLVRADERDVTPTAKASLASRTRNALRRMGYRDYAQIREDLAQGGLQSLPGATFRGSMTVGAGGERLLRAALNVPEVPRPYTRCPECGSKLWLGLAP